MIYVLIIVAGLAAILFGAPALVDPARHAAARRADARTRREAAAERLKQEAAAVKAALARLWTQFPETAGVGETLTYKARVQVRLLQEAQERNFELDQREQQVQHRRRHIRDGNPVTTGYRLRVLVGLVLFLVVFVLGIVLDYLIFRGLHPTGTRLLPLGLACLAVIGITTGSVLFLDANRHHLVPASATPYHRRVIALGGAMLAAGIVSYMVVIAPYRSYQTSEARITQAQQQLASDQSEILADGGSNAELIAADTQAVARARADLAQAQRIDRWSAAALGVLEVFLAEAGFLGAELLLLDLAVARRDLARRRSQQANNALQQADNTFIDALYQTLVRHGHTNADDVIPRILARVVRLGPGTRPPSIGSQPAGAGPPGGAAGQPGQPNGPGQASGPGSQGQPGPSAPRRGPAAGFPAPGMPQPPGGPGASSAGSTGPGSVPGATAFTPNGGRPASSAPPGNGNPGAPGTGPVPGVTFMNPNPGAIQPGAGPVNGQPGPQAGPPGAGGPMTTPAGLPPEEFDMTA
jgi:hypothetical protein